MLSSHRLCPRSCSRCVAFMCRSYRVPGCQFCQGGRSKIAMAPARRGLLRVRLTGRTLARRAERGNSPFVPSTSTVITPELPRRFVEWQPPTVGASRGGPTFRPWSPTLIEQPAPLCVGHRLKAVVGAELAVDVVKVVAQRLSRNAQLAGDRRGIVASGEECEDAALVAGKCLDRRVLGRVIRKRDELPRGLQHAIDECDVEPALRDVARQPHQETAS